MGMTMIEKILARAARSPKVSPGDVVTVAVETAVVIDQNFMHNRMREPKKVFDPEKIVIMLDHIAPADSMMRANMHKAARRFAEKQGIMKFHDVNSGLGICHQLVADHGYALPGSVLACVDSHTCSAGAFNCAARGVGHPEMSWIVATGQTWYPVAETVKYELTGTLAPVMNGKDIILHIANTHGEHAMLNVEFVGAGVRGMSMNTRRTLATMCAEISAEFAVFDIFFEQLAIGQKACIVADLQNFARAPCRVYHLFGLDGVHSNRLFAQHIFARFEGVDGAFVVRVIGRADRNAVEFSKFEHLLVIAERLGVGIFGGGFGECHRVYITERVDFAFVGNEGVTGQMLRICDAAGSDNADFDLFCHEKQVPLQ